MSDQIGLDPSDTLRNKVVERIRSSIVSGRAAPGTMFSVPALAEELGISTTPVREALLELSRTGLVAPRRNRGFQVAATSLDALSNLFAVRELLEGFAVRTLCERRLSDASALRRLARDIEDAVAREDVPDYIEADRAFHHELVSQAANPVLTRLVMEARDAMRLYGIDSLVGRQRQRDSVPEHFRLIELAEAGDAAAAVELMNSHILSWKPIFTEATQRKAARGLL